MFGALDLVKAHPSSMRSVFLMDTKPLLAADVAAAFTTQLFSAEGSNRRRSETRTLGFWRDWLLEVEGKKVVN